MMRFAIGVDVALQLAESRAKIPEDHRLVAPALLRSQMLTSLYAAVRQGALDRSEADARLDHLRGLRIRLLGDRVLQRVAWRIADRLDWPDTLSAEYVAAAQLQADAFVTRDRQLARAVRELVPVASIEDVLAQAG